MSFFGSIPRLLFGSANERRIKSLQPKAKAINALEPELEALSDAALRARTQEFRDKLAAGAATAISVRQHVIRLWAAQPQSMENVVPATVVRQGFLGNSRDYLVTAADGTQLRVVTSPAESIAQGAPVWLHLPPERCRVLSG